MKTQSKKQKKQTQYAGLLMFEIAELIEKTVKVPYAAKPYLDVMKTLEFIEESYGQDSGKSIVRYFLANAKTMKGDVMREIKLELNNRL